MSASQGAVGGARVQYHLRQACVFLNMHPLNKPEVMVTFAQGKIDKSGKVTDEKTREIISQLLTNLSPGRGDRKRG
jgi:chromate reductase